MDNKDEAKLLRIYISSSDQFKYALLSETLVFAAKRYGLTGATVFKGVMGYGSSSKIHSSKFWEITEKLPVVVEIVDTAEKIDSFVQRILPWLQKVKTGCLVTAEKTEILLNKPGQKNKFFNL